MTLEFAADDEVLTATDNCLTWRSLHRGYGGGDCPNRYEITHVVVTDDCGNNTSHAQVVTVVDEIAPEFNEALPADVTLDCQQTTQLC